MYQFSQPGPNLIASSSGRTLEILGRAGLRYHVNGVAIEIDSEMLHPPMSLVIYSDSIPMGTPLPASEILEETIKALEYAGFTVEVIS
ncbi:hypothetical protein BJ973_004036 [Actinoplanes tereljensis]|uniref:Uncharacterized protein n=1 Tax=Paractinoplanes tereljensis TaxID=571912 RepID=A0A919NQU3_9ACTN|nr:hypothetical protein [Actinoplanes tereljensis]GIF23424.1 hypothetical protein Ate02nite_61540 [Actinoplanes tereljensis]